MGLQTDILNHAKKAAANSVKAKTTHLLINRYNELLWQCIPQGETELSEAMWEENAPPAIKQDYYDSNVSDLSNGPEVDE